ncbi:MAG TPA: peptidoglycan DD-metalloendopeptidase family protein [Croceibacterium sp.]|nr:peptidoglycan DD-metalloendopeptidase family protein [Croceibacterium sp.]
MKTVTAVRARLHSWFPDREFFMRSRGQVRFVTVTSKMQVLAAGGALAVLLAWGGSMAVMGFMQYHRASLLYREAKVETAENRVAAYRQDLGKVADDLKRRQDFIEDVLPMLPDDVKPGETVSNSKGEAQKTVGKVSEALPEAAGLARLEARQLAFVENLTRYADRRATRDQAALRKLGLDPQAMLASMRSAQGGPLEKLATSRDGSTDPRFERLGLSLSRMDALEQGLEGVPQVMPADGGLITSGFGYRSDPFTGGGAFHPGLDFKGAYGAPIHAAAEGTVSFVGQIRGYGNVVEISHGNGLLTRYAHMSKTMASVGQKVAAGDVIGAIGSTGRSTGPHLHFEVRINNSVVNPRPFLERAHDVLEEARGTIASRGAATRG